MMQLPKTLADFHLDPASKAPKYVQLKRILYDYLVSLPSDCDNLPFENDIADHFQISRRTVRKALQELKTEGLIDTAKKRGSRIRRDRLQLLQEQKARETTLSGHHFGVILAGSTDTPGRTPEMRWDFVNELEEKLRKRDCSLMVYNLREDHWNTWRDEDKLLASLQEKNIGWTVVYNHYHLLEVGFLRKLEEHRIKPVVFALDPEACAYSMQFFGKGTDFLTVNHTAALCDFIERRLTDCDLLGYLVGANHLDWAQSRLTACAKAAARRGIRFAPFVDESATARDSEVSDACIDRMVAACRQAARPLCFCGNDQLTMRVLHRLNTLGVRVPQEVELIGYDNDARQRAQNLSTFDFSLSALAEAAVDLIELYVRNPERALTQSHGRTVPAVYIPRATTR